MDSAKVPKISKRDTDAPIYEIETERLLFRRMLESDSEALHRIFSNDDAMTYWSRPPHTEISQTMSVISDTLSPARAKDYYFVLCLKPSSSPASSPPQLIGAMGTIKNNIGFILHPSYWRKGIGSEGMVGFLKSFWETQDVGGIEADVDPRNNASLRLLEKFGFVETGRESDTFQTHMGSCNSVYLRLERPKGKSEAQGQTDKERE